MGELIRRGLILFPKSEEEWKSIANEFKEKWNFDTCCDAIEGKLINIMKPPTSGAYYYNYKGKFSIVLLAVNPNHEFIKVHSSINDQISNGGVMQEPTLYEKLQNVKLHLLRPETPSETPFRCPYTFVGDEAFPYLKT
nr:unnamed protein product [Callosobruchus analis]